MPTDTKVCTQEEQKLATTSQITNDTIEAKILPCDNGIRFFSHLFPFWRKKNEMLGDKALLVILIIFILHFLLFKEK